MPELDADVTCCSHFNGLGIGSSLRAMGGGGDGVTAKIKGLLLAEPREKHGVGTVSARVLSKNFSVLTICKTVWNLTPKVAYLGRYIWVMCFF